MTRLFNSIIYLFILINLVSHIKAEVLDECPDPEDNYPCYCEEDEGASVMHCQYLNETKQLYQALSSLTKYKVYKISLYKNEMNPVKSDAFKGPAINQIFFQNSSIVLESPQFVGQEESLRRLTFMSCFNNTNPMKPFDLGHLESLRDITFDRNTIEILNNDWLSKTGPSLRSITFSECGIKTLENKVFQKLTELSSLFLTDNEISSISRSMFPRPAENLRTLSLSNNKLEDLPNDIFEDMPSLNRLELQNNLLKTLSESAWSLVIENFSRVYLEAGTHTEPPHLMQHVDIVSALRLLVQQNSNPMVCDKSLKWISKKALPKTFTGFCKEPAKIKGKQLRLLLPSDFR